MVVALFCAALITFIASLKVIIERLRKEDLALWENAETHYARSHAKAIEAPYYRLSVRAGMDSMSPYRLSSGQRALPGSIANQHVRVSFASSWSRRYLPLCRALSD